MSFVLNNSWLIPLLPLIGAAISGFFGARWLKDRSHWPIWLTVGASAVLSFILLLGMAGQVRQAEHLRLAEEGQVQRPGMVVDPGARKAIGHTDPWFTWISAGEFRASAGAWIDPLTVVMLCVVTGIGLLIVIYARGYMAGDSGYFRFFAYLGLFIFMMSVLVMGENLVMLYLGWEGVGLCSYLLIGHYYERPSAREAAKKAFLVNRVGDFGFALGIMLVFLVFGTVSYFGDGAGTMTGVLEKVSRYGELPAWQQHAVMWIPFLLMLGAFGKSAQFPLYVWLPDAMEGPTPVSALIHAATMVTAGVYMIARCSALFVVNEAAMLTVAAVGAFTAIFAATIALRQFDLKKVFAYSTISQLGFMFVGVGVLAPVAGVFHLVTHAFFKALLFLSSGVVMHAMAGELDLRKMSGLKAVLPRTRWLMLAGCAALAGFPLITAGFYSKDEIVVAAMDRHWLIGLVLLGTALLTAYYTFRVYFRVFEGPLVTPPPAEGHGHGHGHDEHSHHNHEPAVMILPLAVLAIGAIVAGFLNFPGGWLGEFLGHSPSLQVAFHMTAAAGTEIEPVFWGQPGEHRIHVQAMAISGLVAVLGILLAYWLHLQERARAEQLAARLPGVTRVLDGKYWVDEIYQAGIVEPLRRVGRVFFGIDRLVIDGLLWTVAYVPQVAALVMKITVQRGSLQGYALTMLFGVVVILLLVFL